MHVTKRPDRVGECRAVYEGPAKLIFSAAFDEFLLRIQSACHVLPNCGGGRVDTIQGELGENV